MKKLSTSGKSLRWNYHKFYLRLVKKDLQSTSYGICETKNQISVEDYLAGEEISSVKYEYVYGEVYATAGTSDNHNRIVVNIITLLSTHLRDSHCEPFAGDIKVRVSPHVYYYPDILVSCEENPENSYSRNEPILIVEVLSPSTQEIDRREKLLFYQQMPSVQEYIFVEQQKCWLKFIAASRTPPG